MEKVNRSWKIEFMIGYIIRLFDVLIASSILIMGAPIFLLLFVIGFFDTGSPIFKQQRVGKNKRLFTLFKFRSMRTDTESVATHLVEKSSITFWGKLLRNSKLDEIPQFWNVIIGDMSIVGPRPCLSNQEELIAEREKRGLYKVKPGITGLAQINGIDMSEPKRLAEIDAIMLQQFTVKSYLSCIGKTFIGKGRGDRVI